MTFTDTDTNTLLPPSETLALYRQWFSEGDDRLTSHMSHFYDYLQTEEYSLVLLWAREHIFPSLTLYVTVKEKRLDKFILSPDPSAPTEHEIPCPFYLDKGTAEDPSSLPFLLADVQRIVFLPASVTRSFWRWDPVPGSNGGGMVDEMRPSYWAPEVRFGESLSNKCEYFQMDCWHPDHPTVEIEEDRDETRNLLTGKDVVFRLLDLPNRSNFHLELFRFLHYLLFRRPASLQLTDMTIAGAPPSLRSNLFRPRIVTACQRACDVTYYNFTHNLDVTRDNPDALLRLSFTL